ncbi:MAG: ferredoxin [Acidimicrobiales bacterium]
MRVSIDVDRCQGHGRCFSLAPALFTFDDLGNGVVRDDGTVDEAQHDAARLAVANCPEHAVSLQESP